MPAEAGEENSEEQSRPAAWFAANAKRCKVCREEQATAVRKPEVIIAREPKEVRIRILVGECELCGRTCFGRRPLTCNCAVIAPTCIEANHKHRAEVVGECARLGATG